MKGSERDHRSRARLDMSESDLDAHPQQTTQPRPSLMMAFQRLPDMYGLSHSSWPPNTSTPKPLLLLLQLYAIQLVNMAMKLTNSSRSGEGLLVGRIFLPLRAQQAS